MYNLSLQNTTIEEGIRQISSNVPTLFPFILVFEFFVILLVGATASKRFTGKSEIALWSLLASTTTTISSFFLLAFGGIVQLYISGIWIAVTGVCLLFNFATEKDTP